MKLLIQTVAGDMHAGAVAAALETHEIEPLFAIGTDVPERQACSLRFEGQQVRALVSRGGRQAELDDTIEVGWSRRVKRYRLPELHPDDVDNARQEFDLFLGGFWRLAAPRATWVNPLEARESANTKLTQLVAAARRGFAIPETLASHDPEEIADFCRSWGASNLVYKSFGSARWQDRSGARTVTPTSRLDDSLLDEAEDLRLCPGLYQRFIPKAKEVRVTVMRERVHCVELIAGADAAAQVDWRVAQDQLRVRPFELPDAVADRCRAVLADLGLLFGCFDLILDPDGIWYFLEVNEMGQFLWIEQMCPQERYLEAFLSFLFALAGEEGPAGIRLADVLAGPSYRRVMATTLAAAPL